MEEGHTKHDKGRATTPLPASARTPAPSPLGLRAPPSRGSAVARERCGFGDRHTDLTPAGEARRHEDAHELGPKWRMPGCPHKPTHHHPAGWAAHT